MDSELAPQDRPAFPEDAVTWLLGADPRTIVVLSAPQLASAFADYGHDVTNLEGLDGLEAGNETYPQANRSVDAVIATRGVPTNLEEIARILRPGGQLGLICNDRDHRIPWARKLDTALKVTPAGADPADKIVTSTLFGFVSESSFRYWQVVNHVSLEAVIRDELAHRKDLDDLVAAALELYAGYGRGPDGMQLPWVSRCYKATVVESAWAPPHGIDEKRTSRSGPSDKDGDDGDDGDDGTDGDEPSDTGKDPGDGPASPQDGSDSDLLLIDFR
ncbi:MAG: class I SAM-dependent methyltransferase [Nocardioides sp.]|nr:class I SAM-dependent methyltransferase [Nocardioides sp.]